MSVQTEEEEVSEISFSRNPSSHTEEASATDDTKFVKSTEKSKGKQIQKIRSVPKTSSKQTIFSAQDFRSSVCPWFICPFMSKSKYSKKKQHSKTKKMLVQKKTSSEPRKMKQVWVVKSTFAQSEMLITKELKRKKRRVQKFEDNVYSPTDERYLQVSVSKPKFIWVPKIVN